MIVSSRYAGLVELKGQIVGHMEGEPVLDLATHEAIKAMFAARRRGRRPTGRYPLTGLIECSDCHLTMNGLTGSYRRGGGRSYRCPPGRHGCTRSIDATHTEAIIDAYMIELLSNPGNVAEVSAHEQTLTDALKTQLAKVEAVEDQLAELEVKWAFGELVPRAYGRAKPVLDRRLADERAKLEGLEQPGTPTPLVVADDWAEMTDDEKRVLITRFGVHIEIGPHKLRRKGFDPDRITITRP
jgi:site-specific DNA recombinase